MAGPQSFPPRYWIFKDTHHLTGVQTDPDATWITGKLAEFKGGDIVYCWREEDQSYIYAWGTLEEDPFLIYDENTGFEGLGFSTAKFTSHSLSPPLTRADLLADSVLRPLFQSRPVPDEAVVINNAQALALNRLIRARGEGTPPDPPNSDSGNVAADEPTRDQPTDTTLAQLLEINLFSTLSKKILEQAGLFANQREENRDRITTSCIFFAIVESGAHSANQPIENAAQFLCEWFLGGKSPEDRYKSAISEFLNPADFERKRGLAILTMRSMRVIQAATRIANFVRKEAAASPTICARDLVAALLVTMSTNGKLGAAHRLAGMSVNLADLRKDYFNDFLNSEKNTDDNLDRWRSILIDLTPLPEPSPEFAPPEIKPSLPRIDADIPSLKDHLNITPEVTGFANIIAARDVKTPLSIGLFGDWGSGKSTFMRQLQRRVATIANEVREKTDAEETAFLGNIVQIEFNAWHYAEANLWASLVSHIFENLSFSENEAKAKAEQRKELVLGQLTSSLAKRRAAETDVKVKEANYEAAKATLDNLSRARENARLKKLQWVAEGLWSVFSSLLQTDKEAQNAIAKVRAIPGNAGLNEAELRSELAKARTTVGEARLQITSMIQDPRRTFWLAGIILLMILAPLALGWLTSWLTANELIERVTTGVTPWLTLLLGVFTWGKAKHKVVREWLATINEAESQLNKIYERAKAKYDGEVGRLTDEVNARQNEIIEANEQVKLAQDEVVQTLTTLQEMEPGRMLEKFVQERASSDDYRKLLGVVALIRRDFKQLSDMLRAQGNTDLRKAVEEIVLKDLEQQQQEQTPESATAAPPDDVSEEAANGGETLAQRVDQKLKDYRIDRIVLYIDDLDRCPPKQVVDVLQAIHLLLAFEIFVVVVGVDARWVRHALRKRYPEMLDEDFDDRRSRKVDRRLTKAATPRDYVEKIFQIPFWIKPMDQHGSEKFLRRLIPDHQLAPQPVPAGTGSADQREADLPGRPESVSKPAQTVPTELNEDGSRSASDSSSAEAARRAAELAAAQHASATQSGSPVKATAENEQEPVDPVIDLSPAGLLLDINERDTIIALSRVISKSPRTVKRFVNIYRIIKAGLESKRLDALMGKQGQSPQYPAVLLLLGVAHGASDVAPAFFHEVKSRHEFIATSDGDDPGLKAFLELIGASGPPTLDKALQENWRVLIRDLQNASEAFKSDISLSVLREWLPVIVRYTFQLGRLSEEIA